MVVSRLLSQDRPKLLIHGVPSRICSMTAEAQAQKSNISRSMAGNTLTAAAESLKALSAV